MEKIDLQKHQKLLDEGFLTIQKHPTEDLLIHNYSQKAQFERYWVPETLYSRGLITDSNGTVRARPFAKFFNLGERDEPIPNEPFEVYEKMDGSLGVMYFVDDEPFIATRGSFNSDQAKVANSILRTKYAHIDFDPAITYLFEIIYPDNRIVVDYGDKKDLVMLGRVETATGNELPLIDMGMPVAKRYDGIRDIDQLQQVQEDNREGFVIRFNSGYRLKFKFDEYVRLHKIMTQMSPITIWETLRQGGDISELANEVPDEFFDSIRVVERQLRAQFEEIKAIIEKEFKVFESRKKTASYFLTCTYPKILFTKLDGRNYDDLIWKRIRPDGNILPESSET